MIDRRPSQVPCDYQVFQVRPSFISPPPLFSFSFCPPRDVLVCAIDALDAFVHALDYTWALFSGETDRPLAQCPHEKLLCCLLQYSPSPPQSTPPAASLRQLYSFIHYFLPVAVCGFARLLLGEPIPHPCPPPLPPHPSYSSTLSPTAAALPVSSCLAASPILPEHHSGGEEGSLRGILAPWYLDTLPFNCGLPALWVQHLWSNLP